MQHMMTFALGRLNFVNWHSLFTAHLDKRLFLTEQILLKKTKTIRGKKWSFGNFSALDGGRFIFGAIGIHPRPTAVKDFNKAEWAFRAETESTRGADFAYFFIDTESSLILVQSRSGPISNQTFARAFNGMMDFPPGSVAKIVIDWIPKLNSFLDFYRLCERVTSITLEVVPTNPHPYSAFEKLDEAMRRDQVSRLTTSIISEPGFRYDPEDAANYFAQQIKQAESGYGDIKNASGVRPDGSHIKYSTLRENRQIGVPAFESDDDLKEGLRSCLLGILDELRREFGQ